MPLILVTPLSVLPAMLRAYQPSHLISVLSPEFMIDTPAGFSSANHLRIAVHDICDPADGKRHPSEEHVATLIAFARNWDAKKPMIIHCWAGVSRSMATAYTILCDRAGGGQEHRLAHEIRARAPHADPNRAIIRYADALLGRAGAMKTAVEDMGQAVPVEEGVPVEFPLKELGL